MIRKIENYFLLETENTMYCFRLLASGHLEHLYYGERKTVLTKQDCENSFPSYYKETGNTVFYNTTTLKQSLEDTPLEFSTRGKGDIDEPLVEITYADGSFTNDFLYVSDCINTAKEEITSLPSSYDGDSQLVITLKEKYHDVFLKLYYTVFEKSNIIVRSSKLISEEKEPIQLERLLSSSIDFPHSFVVTSFHGGWANEMNMHKTEVSSGKFVLSSYTGTSSSRCNPFFMLSKKNTGEDQGDCYGFNLVYSGNHYSAIEPKETGRTRVVQGISPVSFCFELKEKECFEAAEAVLTYSKNGFNGLSHNMHHFVRNHIIRGSYKGKKRPILVNSWEGCYFSINEEKLVKLAQKASQCGIEMLVMDDGWFGKRNDDFRSLGDWYCNEEKLPNGLKGLCDKVNEQGVQFGLWVEPEMVNEDSDLFRAHPDWVLMNPDRDHSEGRNQRILDIINPEVQDYIIEAMSKVFSSCNLAYVKWDMNRIFSDVYSPYLKNKQKEVNHRYVLALYRIMCELVKRFPEILFEGCSAGGNRFDLGILAYFPQIWASDNTDANCRLRMQNSYSYGYPSSCYTAHVSVCPNHQTGKSTSMEKRFYTAFFGNLGYELNLSLLSQDELEEIKKQVSLYKKYADVIMNGEFYREENEQYYKWRIVNRQLEISLAASKNEKNQYAVLEIKE